MFSNTVSPQKRKHLSEYHDPDYMCLHSSQYKKLRDSDGNTLQKSDFLKATNSRLKNISHILSYEFEKEITLKQEQLTEIDKRLDQARTLLDRLRFIIVSDYYQKQELSLSARDVIPVRGKETIFDREARGPQMDLHPSFKKIIKKRPTKLYDVTQRPLPERAAAQNALNTIRARSQAQRRQERQQLIKEQGMVRDHSNENKVQIGETVNIFDETKSHVNYFTDLPPSVTGKNSSILQIKTANPLNSTRLNNKTKHLIVIGNTSTYIGGESDTGTERKIISDNVLTHKWLVYVQSKDPKINLESFIKKVRFHLHTSYRPNDIVDVRTAPYQIARRGWGEFPMRIQLFFHENLQQKPVQLIHNVVLDRTLSGMHMLGSETLMEIWLRSDITLTKAKYEPPFDATTTNSYDNNAPSTIELVEKDHENIRSKHRTLSFTHNKEDLDDSLFGFLNKTDSVSSDITKIEPSVVVNEQLANISNNSPIKIICKSPNKSENLNTNQMDCSALRKYEELLENSCEFSTLNTKTIGDEKVFTKSQSQTLNITNTQRNISNLTQTYIKSPNTNSEIRNDVTTIKSNNTMQLTTPMIMRLPTTNISNTHQVSNINKNNNNIIALSKVGKFMPLKITNMNKIITPNNSSALPNMSVKNAAGKAVLQKKLVQLVDAEGKIKFMQVLVATTQKPVADSKIETSKNETADSSKNAVSALSDKTKTTTFVKSLTTTIENHTQNLVSVSKDIDPLNSLGTNNEKITAINNINNSKSNTNSNGSPKQMVFQKEGKLFIIDPLQMKLKQERKKQVSLLKPQSNLQRQQQQQMQNQKVQSKALQGMISDHDYTHSLVNISKGNSNSYNSEMISRSIKWQVPELHLGIRQTRAKATNAFELLQQRRIQFEQDFMNQNINTMRSAIDYILRHLPLIAPKNTLAASFSFVSNSDKEFDSMPVVKQRACEWLRAKYITRFVRKHKYLKELNSNNKERFWSTREVLVYARYHAFTPKMKSFNAMTYSSQYPVQNLPEHPTRPDQLTENLSQGHNFSQSVKSEVKSEQKYIQYESITPKHRITSWLDYGYKKQINHETGMDSSEESIDIVSISMSKNRTRFNLDHMRSSQQNSCEQEQQLYLPIPEHLEEPSQLVSDICRDFNIQLQPEEIERDVKFPLVQAVLSQCLNAFIEKLIRRAVALKANQPVTARLNVTSQDIGKVLVRHAEFDFLTNKYFGTY